MIVLMGVPGSGKTVQGKLLADEYGYARIPVGELLRILLTGQARKDMVAGKLLPDSALNSFMDKVLQFIDTDQEFVLDGFPRQIGQADWLMQQVEAGRLSLTAVIHLVVSEEVVRERLVVRGQADDARADDAKAVIAQRFEEYRTKTLPVITYLQDRGARVCKVDGSVSVQDVHKAIVKTLG